MSWMIHKVLYGKEVIHGEKVCSKEKEKFEEK